MPRPCAATDSHPAAHYDYPAAALPHLLQEEDRIITREHHVLKRDMCAPGVNPKRMKEFVVRMLYCEMLGHVADFGYIRAVELTAATKTEHKRVGYLAASLCFNQEHDFRFMLVSQLQRDMQSPNYLEVGVALCAMCKLLTPTMVPALLPQTIELLKHEKDVVRKKAVMALHQFHKIQPESIADVVEQLRRVLCDKDPSVMGASLNVLHDLIVLNPSAFKDLVPSFVSVLKQITEHRLPRDFDYHRMPAPWIQIKLLKILAILGSGDKGASEGMYEVIHGVMRRADTGINVGYAIVYESVRTVTSIYPNATLLDASAAAIARFISSPHHNLKVRFFDGILYRGTLFMCENNHGSQFVPSHPPTLTSLFSFFRLVSFFL